MPDWLVGRFGRRALLLVIITLVGSALLAGSVEAGGSWFYPDADRYEPGDAVTLVGYSSTSGEFGTPEDGPFDGYLYLETEAGGPAARAIPLWVGQLDVGATGEAGHRANRASITFDLPTWVPAGIYFFEYCNAGCEQRLGELIGGYLYVGVDPAHPIWRDWPIDDPEVAGLDDTALLAGPGYVITAGEIRERGDELALTDQYRQCVRALGFNEDLGAQVLLDDDGVPYRVKTSPEVPGRYHGPCLARIGGPETTGSSWMTAGLCDLTMAPPGCANSPN